MAVFEPVIPDDQRGIYSAWQFAPAARAGDLLFCSGSLGVASDGTVPSDPAEQFALAFRAMESLLHAAGGTLANVVDMTSYHVNLNEHFEVFMDTKSKFFSGPYPSWTAIGVAELGLPGALVEIRATAMLNAS
jgi:enamine deaminase RidA (YjgF/YER057c/UK114 family)